jgi:hypothetical protein
MVARPAGFDPNPLRPLRAERVRRNEILIGPRYELLTMPLATWHAEERSLPFLDGTGDYIERWLVGAPALWQPVLDELAAEITANLAEQRRFDDELSLSNPHTAAFFGVARRFAVPRPEFRENAAREYSCDYCGAIYLGVKLREQQRICLCSNACARARRAGFQRRRRRRQLSGEQ